MPSERPWARPTSRLRFLVPRNGKEREAAAAQSEAVAAADKNAALLHTLAAELRSTRTACESSAQNRLNRKRSAQLRNAAWLEAGHKGAPRDSAAEDADTDERADGPTFVFQPSPGPGPPTAAHAAEGSAGDTKAESDDDDYVSGREPPAALPEGGPWTHLPTWRPAAAAPAAAPPAAASLRPRVYLDVAVGAAFVGRVVIELFARAYPQASENFKCLCTGEQGLSGARSVSTGVLAKLCYKDVGLHRIEGGYGVFGGDFTHGDGTGGESIFGHPFDAEKPSAAALRAEQQLGPMESGAYVSMEETAPKSGLFSSRFLLTAAAGTSKQRSVRFYFDEGASAGLLASSPTAADVAETLEALYAAAAPAAACPKVLNVLAGPKVALVTFMSPAIATDVVRKFDAHAVKVDAEAADKLKCACAAIETTGVDEVGAASTAVVSIGRVAEGVDVVRMLTHNFRVDAAGKPTRALRVADCGLL